MDQQQQQDQQDQSPIQMALQDYKEGIGVFTKKMPTIAKKYNAFTEACFEKGKLAKKEKQLIALGISIFSQDEYCIIYHTKGCLDEGCTEDEILETVGVSAAFGGGAAMSQAVTLVQEAMKELGDNQPVQ
ncbi:carboxymuconolactone decarboxylase family protein [Halalkalibacter hemicellulosilyticus]|uniref:Carboxymuconolactone decarboxylase-like domain-containing protein n=1 Tax=Halalkalibacter hemicellulosilyticusJCM 9152 TaxID=1236971 RepID=W4QE00_9BACI|nr:carboxymuconolactone decarboxylase family protein [Halalkalibacter hemicellulosilyticus]GAE30281.1 hypothetical protein JCM9152_1684 [Halalkalibacter hemicellulosilyticusJCM 9152]